LARIKTFPPNEKHLDLLKEKEEEAREKEIGIWKNKDNGKSSVWDLFNIFKIFVS
jgi:endonuclease YncB( thermonuclease family)